MFFETIDEVTIPISRIRRIERVSSVTDSERWEVTLDDDTSVEIGHVWKRHLERQPIAVLPIRGGYDALHLDGTSPSRTVYAEGMLGIAILADGSTLPITKDGLNDGVDYEVYVRAPDGSVNLSGCDSWPTYEEFRRQHGIVDGVIRSPVCQESKNWSHNQIAKPATPQLPARPSASAQPAPGPSPRPSPTLHPLPHGRPAAPSADRGSWRGPIPPSPPVPA